MVSTGWRKLIRDAGREGVTSRKSRLKQNSNCEKQHRSIQSRKGRCGLTLSQTEIAIAPQSDSVKG